MAYRLGVDIGGTHTDVILYHESNTEMTSTIVPTNPLDVNVGILDGINKIADLGRIQKKAIDQFVYGGTLAINMLLEHRDVKIGLIATEGFRDILVIGKAARRGNIYDIQMEAQRPLIPRYLSFGIRERISWKGEVVLALDEEQV